MKKLALCSAAALAAAMIFSATSAVAASWNFRTTNPTTQGWQFDLSKRQNGTAGGTVRFGIQFERGHATFKRNTGMEFTGSVLPNNPPQSHIAKGGGIKLRKGFSTRKFTATCNFSGSQADLKRSQASFWLNKAPKRAKTMEVDMFELRPGGGTNGKNVINYIVWENGKATNVGTKDWNGRNGTYTLTRNGSTYRTTSTAGSPMSNSPSGIVNHSQEIIIHNKVWRFRANPVSGGGIGKMTCTSASN